MKKYKMLCELIRKEQFGEEITDEEKAAAVLTFLTGKNDSKEIIRYKKRMRLIQTRTVSIRITIFPRTMKERSFVLCRAICRKRIFYTRIITKLRSSGCL